MRLEQYSLTGGLTPEQIGLMKRRAIELVERVGLAVPHDGILGLLRQHDGVKVEGQMVKFRPELVEKALREARYPLPEYYGKEWVISAGAHQPKMHDLDTGALRDTTLKDLRELIKIGDALNTVGSAPCVPLDVPIHLQEIQMHKVAWENSRRRANDMFEHDPKPNARIAEYIYEMAQVSGRWFSLGLYMVSPRSFDPPELEIIYRFRDLGVPMWAGTMPISGVNAPLLEKAGILQAMFETLACLTMLNTINRKGYNYIQVIDSFIVHPFDMKYSTFVYGSAEDARGTMDKLAIHKELGLPLVAKSLLTGAKQVDAQSAHEVGVYTMMAALAGCRTFRCAGLLSSGELYSAEKLVVDHEIVQYIRRTLEPEEFSGETLLAEEIAAIKPGESFLEHPSTFKFYKSHYWDPPLFTHSNLGQWQEMGSKSLYRLANERAKKLLKEHSYQIEPEKKRELDRIFAVAQKDQELARSREVAV
jgi:trimethylamine--corrinoid protein Co-methyltransferase